MAISARLSAVESEVSRSDSDSDKYGERATVLRISLLLTQATARTASVSDMRIAGSDLTVINEDLAAFAVNGSLLLQTDILVVEIDHNDLAALTKLEDFASSTGARMPVVAAVRDLSVSATRRLLRAGVIDILQIPFRAEDLAQAIDVARAQRTEIGVGRTTGRRADVIAVMGALGGVGASMIATQAAQMMTGSKQILLIDLDLQRGNVAFYMNLKPKLTLADLVDAGDRLDAEFLRVVAEKHQSGAWVVGAPNDLMLIDAITPDFIERLIEVAATQFDVVILDMFGLWLEWTAAALQKSDLIVLVTEMNVAGLHQGRRQLDVLEANGLRDRVNVVLNRMTSTFFGGYDTRKAEEFLRIPVSYALANDYPTVSEALDEGKQLRQIKIRGRLDRDLRRLVKGIAENLTAMRAAT